MSPLLRELIACQRDIIEATTLFLVAIVVIVAGLAAAEHQYARADRINQEISRHDSP
jgi:uncharacterized membrane protein YoaK (UPF0700 family)